MRDQIVSKASGFIYFSQSFQFIFQPKHFRDVWCCQILLLLLLFDQKLFKACDVRGQRWVCSELLDQTQTLILSIPSEPSAYRHYSVTHTEAKDRHLVWALCSCSTCWLCQSGSKCLVQYKTRPIKALFMPFKLKMTLQKGVTERDYLFTVTRWTPFMFW